MSRQYREYLDQQPEPMHPDDLPEPDSDYTPTDEERYNYEQDMLNEGIFDGPPDEVTPDEVTPEGFITTLTPGGEEEIPF